MNTRDQIARALREAFLAGMKCCEENTEEGCEYDPEAKADELLDFLGDIDKIKSRIERLREAFGHYHTPTEFGGDTCSICGWDIRDPIHHRRMVK